MAAATARGLTLDFYTNWRAPRSAGFIGVRDGDGLVMNGAAPTAAFFTGYA